MQICDIDSGSLKQCFNMFSITVGMSESLITRYNFSKAIECSFCKITMSHHDSDTFTIIPNIGFGFLYNVGYNGNSTEV
jgi:hypothetical protein